jgi:hypothetical protein
MLMRYQLLEKFCITVTNRNISLEIIIPEVLNRDDPKINRLCQRSGDLILVSNMKALVCGGQHITPYSEADYSVN